MYLIAKELRLSIKNKQIWFCQLWYYKNTIIIDSGNTRRSHTITKICQKNHKLLKIMKQRLAKYNKSMTWGCHLLFSHYYNNSNNGHSRSRFKRFYQDLI